MWFVEATGSGDDRPIWDDKGELLVTQEQQELKNGKNISPESWTKTKIKTQNIEEETEENEK
jgi:hypothetical protein